MHKNAEFLLITCGIVFVLGCGGLRPPADMNTYLEKSNNDQQMKRARALDPKRVKAAEQDYESAKEACDDDEQEMCDHYSTMAKIKLETALDKVAIEDATKVHTRKMAAIEAAKQRLETENIRKDAYAERLEGVKKIQQLEAKLQNESNNAEKERMKHKLEMEKRAAELQKRETDLKIVKSEYSKQKGKFDVLAERTQLVEEAAKIVGNSAVKQTPSSVVVTVRGLFRPRKTEMEIYGVSTCEAIAKLIVKYSRYPILIEGHADSKGSESTNLAKSQARAQAVMNQFMENKVPLGRMTATGRGESVPISDNRTKEGKALNRRIEIKFIYPADEPSGKQ